MEAFQDPLPSPPAPSPNPPPGGTCRAVLDVGTNSVKLLVAQVHGSSVHPLFERGHQTRLGAHLFETGQLHPQAIVETTRAASELLAEASSHRPASLRILATAAAREAANAAVLLDALRRALGVQPELIPGDLEADLAFRGVCTDPRLADRPLLVTDVGGGSTEWILGHSGHRDFSRSFPLGAVRLFHALALPENPMPGDLARCRSWLDDFLDREVRPALGDLAHAPAAGGPPWVAVGGTALILARIAAGLDDFDRRRIESLELTPDALRDLTERLWSLPLATRRTVRGLPPERADIILTGVGIHEAISRFLGGRSMRPSTRGLRYAALLDVP